MSFSLDLSMSLPALGDLTAISMSMSLPATLDLNAMGIISTSSTDGSSGSISSKSAKGPGGYLLKYKQKSSFYFPDDEPTDNVCAGAKVALENKLCADLSVGSPQAATDVTLGYVGQLDMTGIVDVSTDPFFKMGMCPVNVHWHVGAEHRSDGQYDENGVGPETEIETDSRDGGRKLSSLEEERRGFRCHHYDEDDKKFTKKFKWNHCDKNMEVGETYEVHWPHSSAGACGTVDQYQTPFYDGVFCNLSADAFGALSKQQIADNVGVQAQVFTIVNDESYFYPDLIKGMITYPERDMGTDVTFYSGSPTGTEVNNELCSQYTPITWQVDRKCHLISASSFDKLCLDMKLQRDDMSEDLHVHGSRELVLDSLAANNQEHIGNRRLTNLRA